MAKDRQQEQLVDFVKRGSIPFSNGLTQTDNDIQLGSIADMQNMKVENGYVVKRNGSIVLNEGDNAQRYYLLEKVIISGTTFIIGINHQRKLLALMPMFPNRTIDIRKNTHFNRYEQVEFDRGISFFLIKNSLGYVFINEFGDAKLVRNNGIVKLAKYSTTSDYKPFDEFSRGGFNYSLYLDVVNVTNKRPPELYTVRTDEKYVAPMKGGFRVGYVNELGVISKLSDEVFMQDYGKFLFGIKPITAHTKSISKYLVSYASPNTSLYRGDKLLYAPIIYRAIGNYDFDSVARECETDLTTATRIDAIPSFSANSDKKIRCLLVPYKTRTSYSGKGYQLWPLTIFDDGTVIVKDNVEAVAQKLASDGIDAPNRYFAKVVGRVKDSNGTGYPYSVTSADIVYATEDESVNNGEFVFAVFWATSTAMSTLPLITDALIDEETCGTVFVNEDTTTYTGGTFEIIDINKELFALNGDSGLGSDTGKTVYVIDIEVNDDDVMCPAYPFIGKYMDALFRLNHIGYDCWQTSDWYDVYNELSFRSVFSLEPMSENEGSFGVTYPFVDDQFAIFHNDEIVGKSQRVFVGSTEASASIVYEDDSSYTGDSDDLGDSLTGHNVNKKRLTLHQRYMSVMLPIYKTLRAIPYQYNSAVDIITTVNDIASNGAHICCINAGRLWIGSSSTLLLEKQIEVSSAIYAVEKFAQGFAVFTSDGQYYLDPQGTLKMFQGQGSRSMRIIASASDETGRTAYATTDTGEVIAFFITVLDNGGIIPTLKVISETINSIKFSPNSKITVVGDTLYIADYDTIYGFNGIWNEKMKFENKRVDVMSEIDGNLVVAFYDEITEDVMDSNGSGDE